MISGKFSSNGQFDLPFIERPQDRVKYQNMLEINMLPEMAIFD